MAFFLERNAPNPIALISSISSHSHPLCLGPPPPSTHSCSALLGPSLSSSLHLVMCSNHGVYRTFRDAPLGTSLSSSLHSVMCANKSVYCTSQDFSALLGPSVSLMCANCNAYRTFRDFSAPLQHGGIFVVIAALGNAANYSVYRAFLDLSALPCISLSSSLHLVACANYSEYCTF